MEGSGGVYRHKQVPIDIGKLACSLPELYFLRGEGHMKIHDITMLIHKDMPVYKNKEDKKPRLQEVSNHQTGKHHESRLYLDIHTGTHFDAPLHMVAGGDTIENIDLYNCITPCKVFDLTTLESEITKTDIEDLNFGEGDFVIFKTRNSFSEEFDLNFVFIEKSAAEYLRDKKVKGVGIDALGVERNQPGYETHKALLGNGITVLEGLYLRDIKPGEYLLCALPLKIKGAEGAPARAVLIEGVI